MGWLFCPIISVNSGLVIILVPSGEKVKVFPASKTCASLLTTSAVSVPSAACTLCVSTHLYAVTAEAEKGVNASKTAIKAPNLNIRIFPTGKLRHILSPAFLMGRGWRKNIHVRRECERSKTNLTIHDPDQTKPAPRLGCRAVLTAIFTPFRAQKRCSYLCQCISFLHGGISCRKRIATRRSIYHTNRLIDFTSLGRPHYE